MGCGNSKAATTGVSEYNTKNSGGNDHILLHKEDTSPTSGSGSSKDESCNITAASSPASSKQEQMVENMHHVVEQQEQRRKSWAVRPGYSSGASSFGSEFDLHSEGDVASLKDGEKLRSIQSTGDISISGSKKHGLALGDLREEMLAQGDFCTNMVRIETPFGKPIEDIYSGVRDGPVLGSGVSGIVRLVTHKATGVKYAVKCLEIGLIDNAEGIKQLRDEIFIMCQLDHPNCVRIEEVYESANEIYIVQELCLGGELFDRLEDQPDYHYSEVQCARLVKQMLSAVRYLHSKGIIHRDLKLENFLFSSTAKDSELKMIDFGLSKHFVVGQTHCEQVGTPYTVAPEIIQGNYNEKSDIWALGVITYLLLSGETPFGGLDNESMLSVKERIMRAKVTFEPQDVWEHVSMEGRHFVKRLLNPNANARPTAKEAQKDPWIQDWAKRNTNASHSKPNPHIIQALMEFKLQSDMQKMLSEVLSFTLLPEQIVDLRKEFEKMDVDGDGEISLDSLRTILTSSAEAGTLGALTEDEVVAIFESIRVRKTDTTIRWHEFLAAGLSQARVDDRNLRLAFDRMDTDRKGFVTFEDLHDLLGAHTEIDSLRKMWTDSLVSCESRLNRISFGDFKMLMKGQPKPKDNGSQSVSFRSDPKPFVGGLPMGTKKSESVLPAVKEDEVEKEQRHPQSANLVIEKMETRFPEALKLREIYKKQRSRSDEVIGTQSWPENQEEEEDQTSMLWREMSQAFVLPFGESSDSALDHSMSTIAANRILYRKNRELRISVLEASKKFDSVRKERTNGNEAPQATLIMQRGAKMPVELQDQHNRALFATTAKKCGRPNKRSNTKTVSDISGMLGVTT